MIKRLKFIIAVGREKRNNDLHDIVYIQEICFNAVLKHLRQNARKSIMFKYQQILVPSTNICVSYQTFHPTNYLHLHLLDLEAKFN